MIPKKPARNVFLTPTRTILHTSDLGSNSPWNGMAVLVQEMIEGEVSGVMFTANPTTGNPNELCIDAVPGVCEPLVSGDDAEVHLVLKKYTQYKLKL